METKMVLNKTEKETPPTTHTTDKPTAPERPLNRRQRRRRLPAW